MGRWRSLARSHLWLRGRVQLAALAAGVGRGGLRLVETCARRLDGEGLDRCRAMSSLLRAGAAQLRGNERRSVAQLAKAERSFAANEMGLLEAVTQLRRGMLLGGSEGQALQAAAQGYFDEQQVADGNRMAALWAPGWR